MNAVALGYVPLYVSVCHGDKSGIKVGTRAIHVLGDNRLTIVVYINPTTAISAPA